MRWLRKLGDLHAIPEVPTITVMLPDPLLLTPAQQRAVLDAIPEARRGVFLALAHHGLRPGEAARLDVADYDFAAGVIQLWPRKAKTRQARAIPCSPELRAWIAAHVKPAGRLEGAALFQNPRGRARNGRQWNSWTLWDTWKTGCRTAKVPDVSLYCGTKHSSATAARRAGVALETIQHALGHADRRSTERYARAAELAPVEVLQPFGSEIQRSISAVVARVRPARAEVAHTSTDASSPAPQDDAIRTARGTRGSRRDAVK